MLRRDFLAATGMIPLAGILPKFSFEQAMPIEEYQIPEHILQNLISIGVERNICVFDKDSQDGELTKRLLSLGKTILYRNSVGYDKSKKRMVATDIYVDNIDAVVKLIRHFNPDEYGLKLHVLPYRTMTNYYIQKESGTFPDSDSNIMIFVDNSSRNPSILDYVPVPERILLGSY